MRPDHGPFRGHPRPEPVGQRTNVGGGTLVRGEGDRPEFKHLALLDRPFRQAVRVVRRSLGAVDDLFGNDLEPERRPVEAGFQAGQDFPHVRGVEESTSYPAPSKLHEQELAAATSVKPGGELLALTIRVTTTRRSSIGCRIPRTASRRNPVNPSRDKTP